jgi:hypothetical protein
MEGAKAIYRFDHLTIDSVPGMLLAEDGTELPLRPKSFPMPHHFVANSWRLADRDELMEARLARRVCHRRRYRAV